MTTPADKEPPHAADALGRIRTAIEVLLAEAHPLATSFRWTREEGAGGDPSALEITVTADTGQTYGLRAEGQAAERAILHLLLRGAVARASLRMMVVGPSGTVPLAVHCARHGWPGEPAPLAPLPAPSTPAPRSP